MSENGEIYTAGKNFTLPPAVTAVTNSTSVLPLKTNFQNAGWSPSFPGFETPSETEQIKEIK